MDHPYNDSMKLHSLQYFPTNIGFHKKDGSRHLKSQLYIQESLISLTAQNE